MVLPCTFQRESHDIVHTSLEVEDGGILEGRNSVRSPSLVGCCTCVYHECGVTDEVIFSYRSYVEVTLYFEFIRIVDNGYCTCLSKVETDIGVVIGKETISGVGQSLHAKPLFSRRDEFKLMEACSEVHNERVGEGLQCAIFTPCRIAFAYDVLVTGDIELRLCRSCREGNLQFAGCIGPCEGIVTCYVSLEHEVRTISDLLVHTLCSRVCTCDLISSVFAIPMVISNYFELIVLCCKSDRRRCCEAVLSSRHNISGSTPPVHCASNSYGRELFGFFRLLRCFACSRFNNLYFCYPKAGTTGITVDTHIFCVFNTFGNNKDRICGSTIRLKRLRVTL